MIFYYSGTGNTRWAAGLLARHLNERLLFIPDELKGDMHYTLSSGEMVGFCFPVHGWQPPHIVREFAGSMHLHTADGRPLSEHYTYTLLTCGDSVGRTTSILQKLLAEKGLELRGHYDIVMPESYVCLPFMYTDTPEREKQKKAQAAIDMERIIGKIRQREVCQEPRHPGALPRTYSYVIGSFFNRYMITDKPFRVDEGKCIGCGKCAEVCSMGNIKIRKGHAPEFTHTGACTCCLSCYHHCPVHAINYGRITERRGQYYFGKTHDTDGGNTDDTKGKN
ncbi:MAG: EFR1 family ferrodoxin [Prevotella sp.]